MNTAGAGMLLGTLIAQLLFPLAVLLLLLCMDGTTASYFNGDQSGAVRTIMNSGIYMALHCLILAGSNVLVALLGCRRIRQPLGGLFRHHGFFRVESIPVHLHRSGLQYVAVLIYAVLKYVGQGLGMEFPEVSFDYFQTGQSTMLVLLYTCILGADHGGTAVPGLSAEKSVGSQHPVRRHCDGTAVRTDARQCPAGHPGRAGGAVSGENCDSPQLADTVHSGAYCAEHQFHPHQRTAGAAAGKHRECGDFAAGIRGAGVGGHGALRSGSGKSARNPCRIPPRNRRPETVCSGRRRCSCWHLPHCWG